MKLFHAFPVEAVQIEKDEIFNINATDKKAYPGDWLVTYEDGTRAILTNAEAHAQLIDGEKGHIEDRSHVVTEEDLKMLKEHGEDVADIQLGDVIFLKDERPA